MKEAKFQKMYKNVYSVHDVYGQWYGTVGKIDGKWYIDTVNAIDLVFDYSEKWSTRKGAGLHLVNNDPHRINEMSIFDRGLLNQ